ncbi:MAG: intradiol ring-cleavage dioxygenase [Candidatus Eremiobacteraeota bacterium]|nr:intradiol ring-cleavage dioxygenase [Candidatus Eremiobacteraeota bacterium]
MCNHHGGEIHEHDRGLAHDLEKLRSLKTGRRGILKMLTGVGVLGGLIGCGGSIGGSDALAQTDDVGSSNSSQIITSENGACSTIPQETEGPYPADGTNGPNTLTTAGIVRNDIRTSFGGLSGTAAGTPTSLQIKLVNVNDNCSPLAGYAIYLWHCNADGLYSIYEVTDQNYLRGVQETDGTGIVNFQTVFPGCYAGRYPHMHFEIFPSLASATTGSNSLRVSQLALPETACTEVYAQSSLYPQSLSRFQTLSIATDNIFSDGADLQIPVFTGTVADGFSLGLEVGIAV